MKKSFQKTLIAASVGAVMVAASMGAHAGTPGTTNLLFPYVTTQAGAFTFISIVNQNSLTASTSAVPLHFTYSTKSITAANSGTCTHLDGDAASTVNDLMQFEIRNQVNVPAAFGDTTSVPKYFPNTAAAANQHGMLIVNNEATSNYGSGAVYQSAKLYGEARIINTATGLAAGYSTDDLHTTAALGSAIDFSLGLGPDGGNPNKVISWFAEPTVNTSFFVIPLGTEASMAFLGNLSATYQVAGAGTGPTFFGGHYNNNEGFQSSTAVAPVTCVGVFSRADLLGTLNAPWSANGGWGNFVKITGTATNALIYKLETTNALGAPTSFVTRAPVL